jgi:hypothetical protein
MDDLDVKKELDNLHEKIKKNENKIQILNNIIDRQQVIINNNLIELAALRSYITTNLDLNTD